MNLKSTLALTALLAGGAVAAPAAADTRGTYVRGDIGVTVEGELEVIEEADIDDEEMAAIGIGRGFENGFRLEGEFAYRDNQFEEDVALGAVAEAKAISLMANLFYDFNRHGSLQPYIGLGVGAAQIESEGSGVLFGWDDEYTGVAYQGLVGVNWQFHQNWSADLGYRYFVVPDAEFDGVVDITPTAFEGDYTHEAVTLGLRYTFGSPAPAPVAAPPPPPPPPRPAPAPQPQPQAQACPVSEFVVYFEWDRSALNQAALETVDAAVARARQCNVNSAVVVGHTDTSGSPAYNEELSERRASIVRDAMVARGFAAGAIRTEARGEGALARPTADGVREPLNRRTAVTISFR